ncbi:hypothetical protein THAOC_02885 [Thalassiosira oceanica]|uniref:Uncharacterized protein n=1 Tax=Thalassiosira oceanica TaxID=159749 RepID=K0TQ42_THAOC|nr:hypothetical protein THAOC_02885 [Thalassiosira oceanica]|eukprot:EJK75392.1 hypothetical protein THAOC_02885 [Thalassiosira oceanica]
MRAYRLISKKGEGTFAEGLCPVRRHSLPPSLSFPFCSRDAQSFAYFDWRKCGNQVYEELVLIHRRGGEAARDSGRLLHHDHGLWRFPGLSSQTLAIAQAIKNSAPPQIVKLHEVLFDPPSGRLDSCVRVDGVQSLRVDEG